MPKLPPPPLDPVHALALAEWRDYENPTAWKYSRKGNMWRQWQGATITIFRRSDGFYGWCVADEEGTHFSSRGYVTQSEAKDAAAEDALFVGQL